MFVVGLKPVSCPVCKTEFSRRYHLIRHNYQTGCDGSKKPTFPCQVSVNVCPSLGALVSDSGYSVGDLFTPERVKFDIVNKTRDAQKNH